MGYADLSLSAVIEFPGSDFRCASVGTWVVPTDSAESDMYARLNVDTSSVDRRILKYPCQNEVQLMEKE